MSMKTMKGSTAIITSGGGMKCAYSAGALVALAKELEIASPDIYVAASGSVGTMFYYLARQYEAIEKAWATYLPSPAFIRYFPFPEMRIDYLIDTIFKQYVPLEVELVETSITKFFVPVTDTKTGDTRFITNHEWFDPYEVMRAAKAMPILYNGHVRLGPTSYLDGDFSTGVATLVRKAIDEGATRILFVTNTNDPGRFRKMLMRLYSTVLHKDLRRALLEDLTADQTISWPDGIQFEVIAPTFELPAVLYSRDPRRVRETFSMGYNDLLAKADRVKALFQA